LKLDQHPTPDTPTRADARPRLSASVLLARDGADGLELFMVQRADRAHSRQGAHVFAGGTVRADDWGVADDGSGFDRADSVPNRATASALRHCAIRELFEEAGVLLARNRRGRVLHLESERTSQQRLALQRGDLSLSSIVLELDAVLALEQLIPFSHWITPVGRPARYDTWFFVVPMPAGQSASHCGLETTAGDWLTPAAALRGAHAGVYELVLPTRRHLERLEALASLGDLLDMAHSKPILTVQPTLDTDGSGTVARIAPSLEGRW
jgi:8-oxo-dGTP pyrophosphatase MutT (NUDIX family)